VFGHTTGEYLTINERSIVSENVIFSNVELDLLMVACLLTAYNQKVTEGVVCCGSLESRYSEIGFNTFQKVAVLKVGRLRSQLVP